MKIYLCGGINGLSDSDAKDWREYAKAELAKHGIECIDPMRRDYRGREDEYFDEIVMGDIADIKASNALLANCARPSWGTAMEIKLAHSEHIPILSVVPVGPISPWLRFFSSVRGSLDEAIAEIIALKPLVDR